MVTIVLGLTVEVVVGACASAPGVNNRRDIKKVSTQRVIPISDNYSPTFRTQIRGGRMQLRPGHGRTFNGLSGYRERH